MMDGDRIRKLGRREGSRIDNNHRLDSWGRNGSAKDKTSSWAPVRICLSDVCRIGGGQMDEDCSLPVSLACLHLCLRLTALVEAIKEFPAIGCALYFFFPLTAHAEKTQLSFRSWQQLT